MSDPVHTGSQRRAPVASRSIHSVLLLCYHYLPSPEIGARRIVALAKYLTTRNIDVSVVHGSAGTMPPSAASQAIEVHHVNDPRPLAIGLLIAIKRALLSLLPSRPAADQASNSLANKAGSPARPASHSSLKALFFQIVHFVDDHKKWAWLASREALKAGRARKVQLVWASGPPMSGLLAGVLAARRLKVPFVADFRDPWSHMFAQQQTLHARFVRRLEHYVLRKATAITCASPGLTRALQERYPDLAARMHTVMNGFDGQAVTPPTETGSRLRIVFAGALYYNRDPFPFFAALEGLILTPGVDPSKVDVIFVGECDNYKGIALKPALDGMRCAAITKILPSVSSSEVAAMYREATVLLNFAQGQRIQVPAKTFEQLISGRELLIICEDDSDTASIGKGVPGVNIVTPGDIEALQRALQDLYERHVNQGRLTPPSYDRVAQYSREAQNTAMLEVFQKQIYR